MTRSDNYYTINKIDKDEKNQELTEKIKAIYAEHKKRYGYRRISLELVLRGYNVNHKKATPVKRRSGMRTKNWTINSHC